MNEELQVYVFGESGTDWVRCAWYVVNVKDGGSVVKEYAFAEKPNEPATNTLAQYKALLSALTWLYKNNYTNHLIGFYTNEEVLVKQMNEDLLINQGSYSETAQRCLSAITKHLWISEFQLITKEENNLADKLCEKSIDKKVAFEVLQGVES